MSHPILINLGVGRSGTTFIHNVLREAYADRAHVLHEDLTARRARLRSLFRCYEGARIEAALAEPGIAAWISRLAELSESRPVIVMGCTTSHLAPVLLQVFRERLRTIHVHRHPLNVCAASYIGAWHVDWPGVHALAEDPHSPVLTPSDPSIRYRAVADRWTQMEVFGRIAYNWLERTAAGIEFSTRHPEVPHRLLDAEREVFVGDAYLAAIAELTGLPRAELPSGSEPARNSGWLRSLEERPLGDAWRVLEEFAEVRELADSLGHRCDHEELSKRAQKYQLPDGLGSRARHAARYWQLRRRVVAALRSSHLLPAPSVVEGGGAPRSTRVALAELAKYLATRPRIWFHPRAKGGARG